ncbi:neuropeptides B/W receptor type 1-like [Liolophura sinensis]|uniref:neuropeptides B/W receptor type 1-like n=1 Tax=Liolophura sinensis TaxID=3198878 RepID=UPI003157F99F
MTPKYKMGLTDEISKNALFVCVLMGLFAVIGLADNIMLFRALVKYKKTRIGLFALAAGLAIADVLYLALGIPVGILYETNNVELLLNSEPFCKVEAYLSHTFTYIAAYHLVAFAVLRAIVLTSRSRRGPTFVQGVLCSLCLWILALLANVPMLTLDDETHELLCLLKFDYSLEQFLLISLGFSFVLPVVLISLIYFATYLVCRRFCEDSYSPRQRQFSKLVSIVISVFIALWLPVNILHLVILYKDQAIADMPMDPALQAQRIQKYYEMDVLYTVRDYFIAIAHLDKFIRPIIYAKMSRDFGKSFDEVVNCNSCFKDDERRGNSSSTAPLAGTDPCPEEVL